jgi:hypothetical protein
MKTLRVGIASALLCLLVACSNLTFNQRLAGGYQIAEGSLSTTSLLLNSERIGSDDAENVLKQVEVGKTGLDVARDIHETDPEGGERKLSAVMAALKALEAYLLKEGSAP